MSNDRAAGLWSAFAAYAFWGVAPIYFMWVQFASPVEVLAQRIVWSGVLLALGIWAVGQLNVLRNLSAREVSALALSGFLLAVNWLTFVWALFNDRMVETSLGYYINPLMSVFLGVVFLGERPRPLQWMAIAIAAAAIVHELVALGELPYAGLTLAVSFALYGFVRKTAGVSSLVGLGVETALMFPIALGYLLWTFDEVTVLRSAAELAMLGLGGLVTIFPLLCFAYAALRVPLMVLGFVQYLAPSITLVLAVFMYDQAVSSERWITFGLIWVALVIFSGDGLYQGLRQRRARRRQEGEATHAAG